MTRASTVFRIVGQGLSCGGQEEMQVSGKQPGSSSYCSTQWLLQLQYNQPYHHHWLFIFSFFQLDNHQSNWSGGTYLSLTQRRKWLSQAGSGYSKWKFGQFMWNYCSLERMTPVIHCNIKMIMVGIVSMKKLRGQSILAQRNTIFSIFQMLIIMIWSFLLKYIFILYKYMQLWFDN